MNIFIAKEGARQGPYSAAQLKELVEHREVSMSDQAWHEGRSGWSPICDMKELVDIILPPLPDEKPPRIDPALPPPLPNLSRTMPSEAPTTGSFPDHSPSPSGGFLPKGGKGWIAVGILVVLLLCFLVAAVHTGVGAVYFILVCGLAGLAVWFYRKLQK